MALTPLETGAGDYGRLNHLLPVTSNVLCVLGLMPEQTLQTRVTCQRKYGRH